MITERRDQLHLSSSIFFIRNRLACPMIAHLIIKSNIKWSFDWCIVDFEEVSLPKEIIGVSTDSPRQFIKRKGGRWWEVRISLVGKQDSTPLFIPFPLLPWSSYWSLPRTLLPITFCESDFPHPFFSFYPPIHLLLRHLMTHHHLWIKYIYGVWHSHSCDLRQNKVFQPENLFILWDLLLRILFHHQPHLIQRVKARHSTKYQPVHHCRCWWRPQACGCRGCRRWRRQEGQGNHRCQWWPHSSRAPHVWPPKSIQVHHSGVNVHL